MRREILWHETCKCVYRLSVAVCNSKQIWNYDKGFSWNPSNCECECDKSCGIGGCLDYKSCACKKLLLIN